jgi:hypothetical protein
MGSSNNQLKFYTDAKIADRIGGSWSGRKKPANFTIINIIVKANEGRVNVPFSHERKTASSRPGNGRYHPGGSLS